MTQYNGYYAATTPGIEVHNQPQPHLGGYDYEDPAGGYDPYAANLVGGDRSSTATVPGLAGFGAQSAQANYSQPTAGYDANGYESLAQTNAHPHGGQAAANAQPGYYFDPKQAYDHSEEDVYGGYDAEHQPPRHQRAGSEGSVAVARGGEDRSLKITNV